MIQLSKSSYRSLALALLAAVAVPAAAATALADAAPPADPLASPAIARGVHDGARVNVVGEVARYVVGPLGHVRGFLLKDGTAVMVRGTAGDEMAKGVPVGQSVRVEGWSPTEAGGKAVMHASVYGQHGQIVAPQARGEGNRDERRTQWGERREEMQRLPDASANGTVANVISGRRGKVMAVVLDNGTSVFLRPSLARAVMERGIRVGDRIQSSGKGASYPLGASVMVSSISFADGTHFEARSHAEESRAN
jgi:hypothetical protein